MASDLGVPTGPEGETLTATPPSGQKALPDPRSTTGRRSESPSEPGDSLAIRAAAALKIANETIEELVVHSYDRLVRYGTAMAGRKEGEDLVQQILFDMWKDLKNPDLAKSVEKPEGLAFKMLKNRLEDLRRAKKTRAKHRRLTQADAGYGIERVPLGEWFVLTEELIHHMLRLLGSLPRQCRRVIELSFFQDPKLKRPEIAKRMDCEPGTVGAHLSRALNMLRTRLAAIGFDHLPQGGDSR